MDTLTEDEEPERPRAAVETGLWCGRCLLPSGVKWEVWGTTYASPRPSLVGWIVICEDCGAVLGPEGEVVG